MAKAKRRLNRSALLIVDEQDAVGRCQLENSPQLAVDSAEVKIALQTASVLERLDHKAKSRAIHKCYKFAVNPDVGRCLVKKLNDFYQ